MIKPIHSQNRRERLYLLFWPVFFLRYLLIEQFHPAAAYHIVHCPLDDIIPFQEAFIVPYVVWHCCIVGVHLWLFARNDPAFRQYSRYLIVSMSISTAVFLLYPTCQNLRPASFERENLLTEAVQLLYRADTNTNVCPSEHVIGSAGFFLAVYYSRNGKQRRWVIATGTAAVLTAVATVFLKQHSVVDVIAALPVCAVGWLTAFHRSPTGKMNFSQWVRSQTRFGRSSA